MLYHDVSSAVHTVYCIATRWYDYRVQGTIALMICFEIINRLVSYHDLSVIETTQDSIYIYRVKISCKYIA